jgi:hypothetical protein
MTATTPSPRPDPRRLRLAQRLLTEAGHRDSRVAHARVLIGIYLAEREEWRLRKMLRRASRG